jgi:hypothetical protein
LAGIFSGNLPTLIRGVAFWQPDFALVGGVVFLFGMTVVG